MTTAWICLLDTAPYTATNCSGVKPAAGLIVNPPAMLPEGGTGATSSSASTPDE